MRRAVLARRAHPCTYFQAENTYVNLAGDFHAVTTYTQQEGMLVRPCLGGPLPQVPYTGNFCFRVLRKKRSRPIAVLQRRTITQNYLRKIAEAEQAWKEQAKRIRAGEQESMLTVLEKRGYINSVAGYAPIMSVA